MPPDPEVPLVPGLAPRPSFVIVHLFAGRRRETDLDRWLAAWSVRANVDLKILSLDTAISPVLGNLDQRSESWQTLQTLNLLKGALQLRYLGTHAKHIPPLAGTNPLKEQDRASGRDR